MGLTPGNLFNTLVILFLLTVCNVMFTAGIIAAALLSFAAPYLYPFGHTLGSALLTLPALNTFWTTLYNMPIIPFTQFNNTVMLGMFVFTLLISAPLYAILRFLITAYRTTIHPALSQSKLVSLIKKSPLFTWLYKIWRMVS